MKVGEVWRQIPKHWKWKGSNYRVQIVGFYEDIYKDITFEMVKLKTFPNMNKYPSYQREMFIKYFERDYNEGR